jgi:D-beta-D-heptose 7-phosphate kinase/D-beta-D-heptose 1-phosphate adenosyltransferase
MVIGDLLLDQFVWGKVSRISPEAPVPVVWVEDESYMPGGACNVASNLARLGAQVSIVGVVGNKNEKSSRRAYKLTELLAERNIEVSGILSDPTRETILKTRVMAHHHPHHQQIVRIDREDGHEVSRSISRKIEEYIKENIADMDALVIEDYGKGLITASLLKKIIDLARKHKKTISVDPKENHFSIYKNVSVVTPNRNEASKAAGFPLDDDSSLKKGGEKLLKELKAEVVLITLGEEGMMLFQKGKAPHKIPTLAQEVFDVSGAGDTVIAAYTLSLVSGASPVAAAHIANCAAGIVVGRVGTAVVGKKELLDGLKKEMRRAGK